MFSWDDVCHVLGNMEGNPQDPRCLGLMLERAGHWAKPLANDSGLWPGSGCQWREDARTFCLASAPGLAPAQLPRAHGGARSVLPSTAADCCLQATVLPLNWTSAGWSPAELA